MAAAAPFVAIAGAVLSAGQQIMSGLQQSSMASANAKIANNNAKMAQAQAAADAAKQKRASEQARGTKIANFSANNVSINDSGSAWDSLINDATLAEMDRLNILRAGENTAIGFKNEASVQKAQASNSVTGGFLSGLASAGSGLYGAYSDGAFDTWFNSSSAPLSIGSVNQVTGMLGHV